MSSSHPADIAAIPAESQDILHDGKEYTTIKEGLAYILVPKLAPKVPQNAPRGDNSTQNVFYNPIQQFNRDLSVLAIKAYGEEVIVAKRKKIENQRERFKDKKNRKRKRGQDGGPGDTQTAERLKEAEPDAMEIDSKANNGETKAEIPDGDAVDREASNEDTVPEAAKDLVESKKEAAENIDVKIDRETQTEAQIPKERTPPKVSFSILDALSATGLRALRYAQEIPFTTAVTANDLLEEATKTIELNVKHNKLEDKITAVTGNALVHMYGLVGEDAKDGKSKKYDVIDLDPYGTAAPFLDAAIQAVRDDGGLLCVTCTDAGVWASNGYPEKAYSLYGGIPMKGQMSHEAGLRLILQSIATTAARYGVAIEPLLSLSIDFYARVFVRVYKSPSDVKFLAGKTMMVYNCDTGCGSWTTQMVGRNKIGENKNGNTQWKHVFAQGPTASEHCRICGWKTHMAGPMWGGPIQSPKFIKKILAGLPDVSKDTYHTTARIEGMLTVALEEVLPDLEADMSPTAASKTKKTFDPAAIDPAPLLFIPSALAKIIHCITPIENSFRGALRHLGYRVTRSHTKPGSIKTDAPWEVIWEIMREWVKQKAPIKDGAIKEGTAGWVVMGFDKKAKNNGEVEKPNSDGNDAISQPAVDKDKKLEIVFDEKLGAEKDAKRLVRYQVNPRENWGPMARARGK